MKRRVLIGVFSLAAVMASAWGAWRYVGLGGSSVVEDWVRRYLVTALQEHLNPEIHIGDLDYEYPRTVSITDFRLHDSNVDILTVNQIRLELAEIPKTGEPILIEQIELSGPAFKLEKNTTGAMVGWSNLMRHRADAIETSVEPGYRVSDFMRLRMARIRNGSFTYRPDAGASETILAGIHAELETPAASAGPGWYQLIGTLSRDELLSLSLDGRINVDSGELVMNTLHVEGTLNEARYSIFPQSVQAMLRRYQLQGSLALDASGAWSPRDDSRTQAHIEARLTDTRFLREGVILTSKGVDVRGDFADNALNATAFGDVLEGQASVTFKIDVNNRQSSHLGIQLTHVNLARLASIAPRGLHKVLEPLQPEGRISGEFKGILADGWALISGHASAAVESAAIRVLQKPLRSSKVTLDVALKSGESVVDVVAGDVMTGTRSLGRDVRIAIKSGAGRTGISAGLEAFGGRADAAIQIANSVSGKYPFSVRTSGIRIEELRSLIVADTAPDTLGGIVSGDLAGTWDAEDWSASSLSGNLSISDGRLHVASAVLSFSSDSMKVKLNDHGMEIDGRLSVFGGTFAGRLSWDVPAIRTVDITGQIQSMPLAALLDASGQSWNKLPGGQSRMDGRFSGDVSMKIPTARPEGLTARIDTRGAAGHVYIGESRVPVDSWVFKADAGEARAIARVQLGLLGGRADVEGNIPLDASGDWDAGWRMQGLQLEAISRLRTGAAGQRYRGLLSGHGEMKGRLSAWPNSLSGRGRLEVTQGQLLELPIIHDIARLVRPAAMLVGAASDDTARASFTVEATGAASESFEIESPLMALRGRGRVQFDGGLDLVIRATAAPKITKLLGPLDRLIDDASGRLVTYRVKGSVERPVIRVEPLGLSVFPED